MEDKWAGTAASTFANAVPEELVAAVLRDADAFASSPNHWVPKEQIVDPLRSPELWSAEACIRAVYRSCLQQLLPPDWQGAEWWVQVYQSGKGLKFHFDKDEKAFKQHATMRHPLFSSVLYLTGDTNSEYPEGPTVILQQVFNPSTCRPVPDSPCACILVYPRRRQFCLFDGALGHGVLESCSSARRVTLLINWWTDSPPQGIHAISDDVASPAAIYPVHWQWEHSELPSLAPTPIPSIVLPQPPREPMLVDELLASNGHAISGSKAGCAASFSYPGYVLYPLQEDGQAAQKTMAAFVPVDMIEDSSTDSEGEGA